MPNGLGLYIHVPFCVSKCGYCDFYSKCDGDCLAYTKAVIKNVKNWGGQITRPIDTVYFGGGTPSLLFCGIADIINAVKDNFDLVDPEITVEANPADDLEAFFECILKAGANRLSLGIQSANDNELAALGRRHNFATAKNTVLAAKKAGFDNLSVDLMLGIPDSTEESLSDSLDEFIKMNPEHISAYMLKIEPGTPFYDNKDTLNLPTDDQTAEMYLMMCRKLENAGYSQYEISNFSRNGKRSRHNMKYWNCDEYIGIGPSAHSFLDGKRFYYPGDTDSFILDPTPVFDGDGGTREEYAMLRLRLCEGLIYKKFYDRFGRCPTEKFKDKAKKYASMGYCIADESHVALTKKGFLVSNTIIGGLYEDI